MIAELVGETLGTFIFFSGIFMLVSKSQSNTPLALTAVGIGLCLTVGILVSSLSGSKSFLNPAVALSMLMAGNINALEMGLYVVAEIIGAILAVMYSKSALLL